MHGVRLGWADLPERVRGWVDAQLGSPVLEAVSQPAGFSPGTADRVVTASGDRAFVKAVSPDQNADTPALHRREAEVLRTLGGVAQVPQLRADYDDGHWVVLILEDVEGRHPLPWTHAGLRATLQTLSELAQHPAPSSWPRLEEELVAEMGSWSRLRGQPGEDLDPWIRERLEELEELALRALPRMAGDAISHTDLRADNLLLDVTGRTWVVDWPWASRGARWCDATMVLVNVRLDGDLEIRPQLPAIHELGAAPEDIVGLVAGLTGFWTEAARRPAPPGLPTLRGFQAAQARAGTTLLQELWDTL